jgi:hypothetical protein
MKPVEGHAVGYTAAVVAEPASGGPVFVARESKNRRNLASV